MSRIKRINPSVLPVFGLFFIVLASGYFMITSDSPVAAAPSQKCRISLALDRSVSMNQERRSQAYDVVLSLFNSSKNSTSPGIGDDRFELAFTSFGTASSGYVGGIDPYYYGSSRPSGPTPRYGKYYPSTSRSGKSYWTDAVRSSSNFSKFRGDLRDLYQPSKAGRILPAVGTMGFTNWEAGLSYNGSGTLPGNHPRVESRWWNSDGSWTTHGVGYNGSDYNLGYNQPEQSDIIIMITDGVPDLAKEPAYPFSVRPVGEPRVRSTYRMRQLIAKDTHKAVQIWRSKDRANGDGKKIVYGIMVTGNAEDSHKKEYLNTAFGSGNWQTYSEFSSLQGSLRTQIVRLCNITWSTVGNTNLQSSHTAAPGEAIRWRHEISRSNKNPWVIKSGQKFNYKTHVYIGSKSNEVATKSGSYTTSSVVSSSSPFITTNSTYTADASDYGKKICSYITWSPSVERPNIPPSGSGRSDPVCAIIGKMPKIQIWGNDIRAGSDIDVSQSNSNGNYYGSWVEYGALIHGLNQNSAFATGAVFAGTHGSPSNSASTVNRLTFANKTNNGQYGQFDEPSLSLPASQNSLYGLMANNQLEIPAGGAFHSNLGTLNGSYTINGNATITTSHIPAGRTILIHVNGTATIRGKGIFYPDKFNSISDIPQVIIVADKINIRDSVTRIDAWLLAGGDASNPGMINTCYNVAHLTTDSCDKYLRINGPLVTDEAKFRRTAGSDDANSIGDPAERIDLRADSYLWEYHQASKHVIPTTVKITQLPPRY